jgi:hypothetical protein
MTTEKQIASIWALEANRTGSEVNTDNAPNLNYQTAHPDARVKMDKIIAGIDLENSDSIVELGCQEREKWAEISDKIMVGLSSAQSGSRIGEFAHAVVAIAQEMQIVSAATTEYIRRVRAGEIKIFEELKAKNHASGRWEDKVKLQLAQANWQNLLTVDVCLLGSIRLCDMSAAHLAFIGNLTKENAPVQTVGRLADPDISA